MLRWVAECSAMPETLAGTLIRRFAAHVLTLADALLDDLIQFKPPQARLSGASLGPLGVVISLKTILKQGLKH